MHGVVYEGGGFTGSKAEIHKSTGKDSKFEGFRQSFIAYSRHLRLNLIVMRDTREINVGDPKLNSDDLPSYVHGT